MSELPLLYILVLAGSVGLAILTLLAALRWPLIRGKHILCAALAIELGNRLLFDAGVFYLVRAPLSRGEMVAIQWAMFLSRLIGAVLLLVFVVVMGTELRARLSHDIESGLHEERRPDGLQ